jgi:hypothetical protein
LDVWTYAANINGRRMRGTSSDDQWRWLVEGRGTAFEGVHLQVFYLGGAALEQAHLLAIRLGELPYAEDEDDKVRQLSKSN